MGITLSDCYNTAQFRRLAKARLPGPIFHYIDGAADDDGLEPLSTLRIVGEVEVDSDPLTPGALP